jgi:uncharacterized protein (TIGR02594 family)
VRLRELGYIPAAIVLKGNFGSVTLEAVKKFQREHLLIEDGMVGPQTWASLFPDDTNQASSQEDFTTWGHAIMDTVTGLFIKEPGSDQSQASVAEKKVAPHVPSWLLLALSDLGRGIVEKAGSKHNPEIVNAHGYTTLKAKDDETPWCSSYVCYVMERLGIKSTRSAAAASWASWGKELEDPRLGCVVVMSRTGGNHVAFYLDQDSVGVYCLGGNQDNRLSVRRYSGDRVTSFRWPT